MVTKKQRQIARRVIAKITGKSYALACLSAAIKELESEGIDAGEIYDAINDVKSSHQIYRFAHQTVSVGAAGAGGSGGAGGCGNLTNAIHTGVVAFGKITVGNGGGGGGAP